MKADADPGSKNQRPVKYQQVKNVLDEAARLLMAKIQAGLRQYFRYML
jgi:hypothetical protein